MTLIEPDVALTDFALAAECAAFAGWLHWGTRQHSDLRRWFVVLFVSLAMAALLGGITHGFFADAQSDTARAVWIATLVAIAAGALASWAIGVHLLFAGATARWLVAAAALLFALNLAVVVWVDQSFLAAIAFYAPAVVFALIAFVLAYRASRNGDLLPAIAGTVLSLAAAVVQQTQTGIASLGLSYNALYHLVQAVGLFLIFLTARGPANGQPAVVCGAFAGEREEKAPKPRKVVGYPENRRWHRPQPQQSDDTCPASVQIVHGCKRRRKPKK